MNIEITSKLITVTPTIREHIQSSFEKLEKFEIPLINLHLIIDKTGKEVAVEARILIPGTELFAKAQHEELSTAINRLTDKLKQQLISHRGKQTARRTQAA